MIINQIYFILTTWQYLFEKSGIKLTFQHFTFFDWRGNLIHRFDGFGDKNAEKYKHHRPVSDPIIMKEFSIGHFLNDKPGQIYCY